VNEIRAFMLERGVAVAKGIWRLRRALPDILAAQTSALSPRILRTIEALTTDWRRLDTRVDEVSAEIEALARKNAPCKRLMTVPGIGPLISSATVDTIVFPPRFARVSNNAMEDRSSRRNRELVTLTAQV